MCQIRVANGVSVHQADSASISNLTARTASGRRRRYTFNAEQALECIVEEEDTSDLDDLDGLCREDEFLEFGDRGLDSGENAGDNSGAVSDSFDADDGKGRISLGSSPPK